LVTLRAVLDSGGEDQDQTADPLQVIVFNDGERSLGVVVDQILDVAEETISVRQKTSRKGLLGSAVVGKQVADFLDLNHVIRTAAADWFQGAGGSANGKSILVADASAFSRSLIRGGLDMAGYRVLEAANLDEVIRGLERRPVDVVVTSLDLPPGGSSAVLAALRQRPEWQAIPVLALADQVKFDRDAMLESVARLASALVSAQTVPVCAGEER
jgi:two-component system chemotaxis sensor kinase CheA